MATRPLVCYIAVCDVCGQTSNDTEDGLHADSPEEAIQNVTGGFDEHDGWTITPDGRLVCNLGQDAIHEDAHAAAGKRMGHDAMSVTFQRSLMPTDAASGLAMDSHSSIA